MFDHPPKERESLSWTCAVLWAGVIFVTVPFVRPGVDFVRGQWGGEAFTYAVAAIAVATTAIALHLIRRRGSLASFCWLVGLGGLVVYLTFDLAKSAPDEAVHFVQYGVLSVLLYRAFVHRIRDYSVYVAATIAGALVGMIDETVQWLTPGRYFDTRDIWLNFVASGLVQVGIATGIRPWIITGWPGWASLSRLSYLTAAAVAYLGLCYINTPDRIAWYTEEVPLLGLTDARQGVMVEYGHLHGDKGTVSFRSRLTAEDLRRLARERAEEGGRILDRYGKTNYGKFLQRYTPLTDPFLHEARVRLFRRDIYLARARQSEGEARAQHFAIAYWENRILEDYFGELLRASSFYWPTAVKIEVGNGADANQAYHSGVSQNLIVAFSPLQVALLFLCAVTALILMGLYFARRSCGGETGRRTRAPGQDVAT